MSDIPEIKFVARFQSETQIPADLVAKVLLAVDEAVLDSEYAELDRVRIEIPQLSDEMINTIKSQLDSGKLKGVYLDQAASGSIILTGIIAGGAIGAAWWLLQNTLGEDIKTAWQNTSTSQKFRQLLLSGSSNKVDELIARIKNKIERTISLEFEGVLIDFRRGKEEENFIIAMIVMFTENYPKTRGKLSFQESQFEIPIFKDIDSEGSAGAAS